MADRNPYVILGIPFGAGREEANLAFARRARPLRRLGAEGRDRMTELTWALNQIDEAIKEPDTVLWLYRIPHDPAVLAPSGPGEFAPKPRPMARRSGDSGPGLDAVQRAAAREHLRHLVLDRAGRTAIPAP
ncbi:hypothetical protein FHR83_004104 [Actinoplanes campanulatus]|uniref:Uncharacterized protein n=2 Tax=Actinoplanes TaxID=1865 RepID=A0A7W5AIK8_9ACTN|nr:MULTISPECIES: hypothetical protein [Actinoplanes]MBB3096434.1 hypothetical protein [Actinoplanes campanulatus]MBO3737814.1 hypothetical protein [Actinoplanes flavus]GGN18315.1 hypothetical protein GCM10010109_31360 [Actinoplanes campanulatus]GID38500.1 hypothetical protein Aca09nite_50060 [Actinoplanes campanulatus]GID48502.1 hypothetical protein Aca07nite_57770 [Actinoplanes capillaceus]